MTDVFMIHRAAGTQEAKLRFELTQARAEIISLKIDLEKTQQAHDFLIDNYIKDAAYQRKDAAEKAELEREVTQLRRLKKGLSEDLGPLIGAAFMAICNLNKSIDKWSRVDTGSVPQLPIHPDMAEVFEMLEERLSQHVKVISAEDLKNMMEGK